MPHRILARGSWIFGKHAPKGIGPDFFRIAICGDEMNDANARLPRAAEKVPVRFRKPRGGFRQGGHGCNRGIEMAAMAVDGYNGGTNRIDTEMHGGLPFRLSGSSLARRGL